MTLKVTGLDTAVSFPCGFCGGTLYPSDPQKQPRFLLHSMPHCPKFEEMDAVDFMVASRKARGISAPWDGEGEPQ